MSASDPGQADAWLARRIAGEPLEQIVEWVAFGPHRLATGPGVFVPRQRSLLLAATAARRVMNLPPTPTVVEAFCGVAPIGSTIIRARPDVALHVTDIDPRALAVARRNLPATATVHHGSVLEGLPSALRGRVDLIVAVPPYVPDEEAEYLPREAREYEPARALFGGRTGTDLVASLLTQARSWLAPNGALMAEMNIAQTEAVGSMAHRLGYRTSEVVTAPDDGTAVLVVHGPPDPPTRTAVR